MVLARWKSLDEGELLDEDRRGGPYRSPQNSGNDTNLSA